MRCRSYRSWGIALARNLGHPSVESLMEAKPALPPMPVDGPKCYFKIDYKNSTIVEITEAEAKAKKV